MSDDFLVLVPRDPRHIPPIDARKRVLEALARIAPNAEELTSEASEEVRFFDCGSNFERIVCPRCSADVDLEWWHDRMDEDSTNNGFLLATYAMPCCGGSANLNELVYDWPQTFGRFAWEVRNPAIGDLTEATKADLEAAAGMALAFVRQHL